MPLPLLPATALDHYRRGAPGQPDFEKELRAIFGRTPDEPLPDLSLFPPELMEFESPKAESGSEMLDRMPAFDREGERGPYYRFNFQLTLAEGGKRFVTEWVDSSRKLKAWLQALGVPLQEQGDAFAFDDEDVAPRKVGGLDIKPPRQDKNDPSRFYTGGVRQVIGQ